MCFSCIPVSRASWPLPINKVHWKSWPLGYLFRWGWLCPLWECYTSQLPIRSGCWQRNTSVSKRQNVSKNERGMRHGIFAWLRSNNFLRFGLVKLKKCRFAKIWRLTSRNWVKYWPRIKYLLKIASAHRKRSTRISAKLMPGHALPRFERRLGLHSNCPVSLSRLH